MKNIHFLTSDLSSYYVGLRCRPSSVFGVSFLQGQGSKGTYGQNAIRTQKVTNISHWEREVLFEDYSSVFTLQGFSTGSPTTLDNPLHSEKNIHRQGDTRVGNHDDPSDLGSRGSFSSPNRRRDPDRLSSETSRYGSSFSWVCRRRKGISYRFREDTLGTLHQ